MMLIAARCCGVAPLLSFTVPTIVTVESSASMYVNSYLTIINCMYGIVELTLLRDIILMFIHGIRHGINL